MRPGTPVIVRDTKKAVVLSTTGDISLVKFPSGDIIFYHHFLLRIDSKAIAKLYLETHSP